MRAVQGSAKQVKGRQYMSEQGSAGPEKNVQ